MSERRRLADGNTDTVMSLNVRSWSSNVDAALRDKIEDDASEMAAFMMQLMESYLVGPQYSGYDGVAFINSTRYLHFVLFSRFCNFKMFNFKMFTFLCALNMAQVRIQCDYARCHRGY